MEFYCHLCLDWIDTAYCEAHYNSAHGSKDMTLEKLKKRMGVTAGGLDIRDEKQIVDNSDDERSVFVTNNFRHSL